MKPEQQQGENIQVHGDDAVLFDRYGQTIFAYIRLHLPLREDAEDLTLEVFTAALENANLAALQEHERLAWLRRVAHNKLIDTYRRIQRRPTTTLDMLTETVLDNETETPEQVALRQERYAVLHNVIKQLPILQQQILRLRYGDGLPFAEIAVLVNKREEAVRKILSRTLSQLRGIYKANEGRD